jgi:hypothetical protein
VLPRPPYNAIFGRGGHLKRPPTVREGTVSRPPDYACIVNRSQPHNRGRGSKAVPLVAWLVVSGALPRLGRSLSYMRLRIRRGAALGPCMSHARDAAAAPRGYAAAPRGGWRCYHSSAGAGGSSSGVSSAGGSGSGSGSSVMPKKDLIEPRTSSGFSMSGKRSFRNCAHARHQASMMSASVMRRQRDG